MSFWDQIALKAVYGIASILPLFFLQWPQVISLDLVYEDMVSFIYKVLMKNLNNTLYCEISKVKVYYAWRLYQMAILSVVFTYLSYSPYLFRMILINDRSPYYFIKLLCQIRNVKLLPHILE